MRVQGRFSEKYAEETVSGWSNQNLHSQIVSERIYRRFKL